MSLPECAEPVSRKRKDGDHFAAPRNSIDHIIEVYKRDADATLIDECLSRTVEQRLQALQDMMNAVEELRLSSRPRNPDRYQTGSRPG